MMKENNTPIRAKDCLRIVFWELTINKALFLFYMIVTVLLFSISVGLLSLAFRLPELIAGELKEANADNINIANLTLSEAETVLSRQVELLDATLMPQALSISNFILETDSFFWGGILLDGIENTAMGIDFLAEKMLAGNGISEVRGEASGHPIWLSKGMAEELGLNLDSRLPMLDFNENELCDVYVAGIFESDEHFHFYISQGTYYDLAERHLNLRLSLYIRPLEFREFNHLITWAEKNRFHIHYSRDVIFAVQMVYYTFFVLNFILLITLAGIVSNMLNIYFSRRMKFYAVNLAMGMTTADILRIMFYLCQAIIMISVFVSFGISLGIINNISSYVQRYFEFADGKLPFPVVPILVNGGLLQALMGIVLLKFNKTNKNHDIVSIIRHSR